MSYIERHTLLLTTNSGAVTGYTPVVTGRIISIQYVKDDYAAGVDFAITGETSGINIWTQVDQNASVTKSPRQPTHDAAGVASLFAGSGEPVEDYIAVAKERIKVAVTNGGTAKKGTFHITVG